MKKLLSLGLSNIKMDLNKYCHCNCGGLAPIAKYTCQKRGWTLGQPIKFIHGHNQKGKTRAIPSMLGKKHSLKTREKMRESARKGEESNFWRGGVYEKNELDRRSSRYRIWREAVYERDNYTCQFCKVRGVVCKQTTLSLGLFILNYVFNFLMVERYVWIAIKLLILMQLI